MALAALRRIISVRLHEAIHICPPIFLVLIGSGGGHNEDVFKGTVSASVGDRVFYAFSGSSTRDGIIGLQSHWIATSDY